MNVPKRPYSHVIAGKGLLQSCIIFNEWGWTADPIQSDYGEDIECNIFYNGFRSPFSFRCQVKSTKKDSNYVRKLRDGSYSFSIKTSHCNLWLNVFYPVFLIIYDDEEEMVYWTDIVKQIKENTHKLSQKTMTIKIDSKNILNKNRDLIENYVKEYYENMFKIEEPVYSVEIIPLIMPGNKSLSMKSMMELKKKIHDENVEFGGLNINTLPYWGDVIQQIDPFSINCFKVTLNSSNFNIYSTLSNIINNSFTENDWISLIVSPIYLHSKNDDVNDPKTWKQEISDWTSYSYINGTLNLDFDYSFKPPIGFLGVVGRHGSSWSVGFCINPTLDVAIDTYVDIPVPRSYLVEMECMKKHAQSNFIPWIVPKNQVEVLNRFLLDYNLVFNDVSEVENANEEIHGVICTNLFNPYVGFFTTIDNWVDYDDGLLNNWLDEIGANNIPGSLGSDLIRKKILEIMGYDSIPDSVTINVERYIHGRPILHHKRIIHLNRFRLVESLDENRITMQLAKIKKVLSVYYEDEADYNAELFTQPIGAKILIYLDISWKPRLYDSNSVSLYRFIPLLLPLLDDLFPPLESNTKVIQSTYDILRYVGDLYFEGGDAKRMQYWQKNPKYLRFYAENETGDLELVKTTLDK